MPIADDPASLRAIVRSGIPEDWQRAAKQREAEDAEQANRRNRGGRPRSPNPRTGQVMVRLSPDERARLDELAGERGIAEFLRAAGLGRRPKIPRVVPVVNAAAWAALGPVVANLNQIALHLNQGRVVASDDLRQALEDVRIQVVGLRAGLVGGDKSKDGAT